MTRFTWWAEGLAQPGSSDGFRREVSRSLPKLKDPLGPLKSGKGVVLELVGPIMISHEPSPTDRNITLAAFCKGCHLEH